MVQLLLYIVLLQIFSDEYYSFQTLEEIERSSSMILLI